MKKVLLISGFCLCILIAAGITVVSSNVSRPIFDNDVEALSYCEIKSNNGKVKYLCVDDGWCSDGAVGHTIVCDGHKVEVR